MMVRLACVPASAAATVALLAATSPNTADAHGFIKCPRARNVVAAQCGIYWAPEGVDTSTFPAVETCPHCLNVGGPDTQYGPLGGVCGITQTFDKDYTTPRSFDGSVYMPTVQAVYDESEFIQVDSVITAHHKGHIEMYACALAVPTLECFKQNPLELVRDRLYDAPVDPNYPERAYLPPPVDGNYGNRDEVEIDEFSGLPTGLVLSHTYQLPQGVTGPVKLLWKYLTANSCTYPGYAEYFNNPNNTFSPAANNWWRPDIPQCPDPLPFNDAPEQFWNCVDVCVEPADTPASGRVCPETRGAVCNQRPASVAPVAYQAVETCVGGSPVFPGDGDQPAPEQPPTEPEQPPTEPEQPPTEPEQPPTEPVDPVSDVCTRAWQNGCEVGTPTDCCPGARCIAANWGGNWCGQDSQVEDGCVMDGFACSADSDCCAGQGLVCNNGQCATGTGGGIPPPADPTDPVDPVDPAPEEPVNPGNGVPALPTGLNWQGYYAWTWNGGSYGLPNSNIPVGFSGYVDVATAIANYNWSLPSLNGSSPLLSLGGGNDAGSFDVERVNAITRDCNDPSQPIQSANYAGIIFDVEIAHGTAAELVPAFAAAFAACKSAGLIVGITVSHSAPYETDTASVAVDLMTAWAQDANIDFLSPQLYTTGYELVPDFEETSSCAWAGCTWDLYYNMVPAFVPSINLYTHYDEVVEYFEARGISCEGFIQWVQTNSSEYNAILAASGSTPPTEPEQPEQPPTEPEQPPTEPEEPEEPAVCIKEWAAGCNLAQNDCCEGWECVPASWGPTGGWCGQQDPNATCVFNGSPCQATSDCCGGQGLVCGSVSGLCEAP